MGVGCWAACAELYGSGLRDGAAALSGRSAVRMVGADRGQALRVTHGCGYGVVAERREEGVRERALRAWHVGDLGEHMTMMTAKQGSRWV